jgi:hypothetical protein
MKLQRAIFALIEMMFLFAGESSVRVIKAAYLDLALGMENCHEH